MFDRRPLLLVVLLSACMHSFDEGDAQAVGHVLHNLAGCPTTTEPYACDRVGSATATPSTLGFTACEVNDAISIATTAPLAVAATCSTINIDAHLTGELDWSDGGDGGHCTVDVTSSTTLGHCELFGGDGCETFGTYHGTICDQSIFETCTTSSGGWLSCSP